MVFTLLDNETHTETEMNTDTNKLAQNPIWIYLRLSLCSMNTSTQFWTTHFLSMMDRMGPRRSVNSRTGSVGGGEGRDPPPLFNWCTGGRGLGWATPCPVPRQVLGRGYPPPVDRQTENTTFPHTPCAGGSGKRPNLSDELDFLTCKQTLNSNISPVYLIEPKHQSCLPDWTQASVLFTWLNPRISPVYLIEPKHRSCLPDWTPSIGPVFLI